MDRAGVSEGRPEPRWKRPALTEAAPAYDNYGCGARPITLDLRRRMAVGFGSVAVTRDGEHVWQGDTARISARHFERKAALDPDHDWRIEWIGPLRVEVYQRHGKDEWSLIEWNEGFA